MTILVSLQPPLALLQLLLSLTITVIIIVFHLTGVNSLNPSPVNVFTTTFINCPFTTLPHKLSQLANVHLILCLPSSKLYPLEFILQYVILYPTQIQRHFSNYRSTPLTYLQLSQPYSATSCLPTTASTVTTSTTSARKPTFHSISEIYFV